MAVELLEITTHHAGGRVVLVLAGEITRSTRQCLVDAAAAVIEGAVPVLELDLAEVRYCDSSGLSALVGLQRAAQVDGKRIVLANSSAGLELILRRNGLTLPLRGEDQREAGRG